MTDNNGCVLDELQQIVNEIGRIVGAPTSLVDTAIASVVFGPHDADWIDEVRRNALLSRRTPAPVRDWFLHHGVASAVEPLRLPPNAELAMASRVVVPCMWRGRNYGYVSILDPDEHIDIAEIGVVVDLARRIGRLLEAQEHSRALDTYLVRDLLTGDEAGRREAASQLVTLGRAGSDSSLVVAAATAPEASEDGRDSWPAAVLRMLDGNTLTWLTPQRVTLVIPLRAPTEERDITRAVRALRGPDQDPDDPARKVGLGSVQVQLEDAHLSYRHALAALKAASMVVPRDGVSRWDRLGAWRALTLMPTADLAATLDSRVSALGENPTLAETVEAYLEHGCDAAAAAATLHVHRGTLYYRLRRATEISGLDLGDGGDRLTAHLGLMAMRLLRQDPGADRLV